MDPSATDRPTLSCERDLRIEARESHTSGTFAFATVAAHYYGMKVSIPAYAVAALVGASRIEKGKHFLSDVVFGATLGYIAGRTAVRGTERSRVPGRFAIHPMIGFGRSGLIAELSF